MPAISEFISAGGVPSALCYNLMLVLESAGLGMGEGAAVGAFGKISSLLDAVDMMEAHLKGGGRGGGDPDRRVLMRPAPLASASNFTDCSSTIGMTLSEEDQMSDGERSSSKNTRKRIDPDSVKILMELFESGVHFPSREQREGLAKRLSLPSRTIQIWFQNKRQAYKNRRSSVVPRTTEALENLSPILMTKLKYDKEAQRLVETRSNSFQPAYAMAEPRVQEPRPVPRRASEPSLPSASMSIERLTKIEIILPRPPVISQLSPMMQGLPRELPKLCPDRQELNPRLPSICHALRRFTVY